MKPTEKALFRIDYDARWYHDGGEIKRAELAKLFAIRGLRQDEEGQYWLQSPESRYQVDVEDVPFIIVDYDIKNVGPDQTITLKTNMDESVDLGPDRRLELRPEPRGGMPVPYVLVRSGLYARIHRPVYYKLIALGDRHHGMMSLRSGGIDHPLGTIEDQD